MDSPREPVPSLREAATLLLRSAAVQLRRSVPQPRQPVAAGSPGAPIRLAACRRGTVPRHVVTCAAVLLVIVGATAALTWLSWQTLQDRQVQLGGERDLPSSSADERSLVDDLVRRDETKTDSPPAASVERGPASLERPTSQLPTSGATSISLDGRILAGAVIAAALAAATGASLLVVRHFRRRNAAELQLQLQLLDDPRAWLDDLPDLQPALPQEPEGPLVMHEEEPLAAAEQRQDDDTERQVASLLVEQRRDESAGLGPDRLGVEPPEATGGSLPLDLVEQVAAASWTVDPPAAEAGGGLALQAPLAPDSARYDDLVADDAARERIFDRRVSRRVPYVKPAWLWWAEQNAPVMVQDLSLTGLRCLLGAPAGTAAPVAPALADQVRVFFPVNGSTVKAAARVQWREHTPQGTQMGLEFVDLPADDVAAVRQLLVEAED